MKVLLVHNRYRQAGGEDIVFDSERALLASYGHDVQLFTTSNEDIKSLWSKTKAAGQTVYSSSARRSLAHKLDRVRPDVVHVHNFFPLLSPSVYYACRDYKVPVVQTLHNYRLLCPNALFFRDGGVCEDCLGRPVPWPGVVHGCYRGSRTGSAPVAAMLSIHRALRTWVRMVDVYVALTVFAREKFIQGGIPAEKIMIKPNFVHPDPGVGEGHGKYVLFVGRLSREKGLETLLSAWEQLAGKVQLKVVGDGPLAGKVAEAAERFEEVEWLGRQPKERVMSLMKDAWLLAFPSVWYETFGIVLAEACAVGLPVIASDLGGTSSLINHGRTGLLFRPGDPEDLAVKVEWALSHPAKIEKMRGQGRVEFETKYTAERNYQALMEIYHSALAEQRARL